MRECHIFLLTTYKIKKVNRNLCLVSHIMMSLSTKRLYVGHDMKNKSFLYLYNCKSRLLGNSMIHWEPQFLAISNMHPNFWHSRDIFVRKNSGFRSLRTDYSVSKIQKEHKNIKFLRYQIISLTFIEDKSKYLYYWKDSSKII